MSLSQVEGGGAFLVGLVANTQEHVVDARRLPDRDSHPRPLIEELVREDYRGDHEVPRYEVPEGDHRQEERPCCLSELSFGAV